MRFNSGFKGLNVAQHVVSLIAFLNKIRLMHAKWPLCDELTSVTFILVGRQSVRNCNPEPRLCNIKWWKFTSRRRLTLCRVRIICPLSLLVCILVRDTSQFLWTVKIHALFEERRSSSISVLCTFIFVCITRKFNFYLFETLLYSSIWNFCHCESSWNLRTWKRGSTFCL